MNISRIVSLVLLSIFSAQSLAGAWDIGPFDNDDALDWVWELSESKDLSVVSDALQAVSDSPGYLEAPTGSMAIAAAEVVAALRGNPRPQLPAEVSGWVSNFKGKVDDSLVESARQAIAAVKNVESSELAQLWSESGGVLEEWHTDLDSLSERLK